MEPIGQRCVEPYKNHRYGEGGRCEHEGCAATRSNGAPSSGGGSGGPGSESLENIASELEGSQPRGPKDTKWSRRKQKDQVEAQASRELAKANARMFVQTAEGAKHIAFRAGLGIDLRSLSKEEESGITANLTRVLELLEYDISNPKVAVALFLLSYGGTTYQQYQDALGERVSEDVPERA